MLLWFKCFADVPNVNYPGHPTINRTRLPNYEVEAKRSYWRDENNKRQESLMWERDADHGSSQSPALAHWWRDSEERRQPSTPQQTLQRAFEALELPGTLSDYHWVLEDVSRRLWSDRKKEPRVLGAIEQFCWQDIRLLEAHPKLDEDPDRTFEMPYSSFEQIINLYAREGFLGEALSLVRRAQKLTGHEQYPAMVLDLTQRMNRLATEGN